LVGEKTRGGEGNLIIICTFLSLNESQRIINDPDTRTGFGKEGLESGCVCNDFKSRILLGNRIRRGFVKKKKTFRSRSFGLVGGDFQNINFLRIIDCYELVINCVDEGSRGTNECQVIKICRI